MIFKVCILSIKENMKKVLETLSKVKRTGEGEAWIGAEKLSKDTGLKPMDLNDAVELLVRNGDAKWKQCMGTAPYKFHSATITSAGRLSLE